MVREYLQALKARTSPNLAGFTNVAWPIYTLSKEGIHGRGTVGEGIFTRATCVSTSSFSLVKPDNARNRWGITGGTIYTNLVRRKYNNSRTEALTAIEK